MDPTELVKHYDGIIRDEAKAMLGPLIERVCREYLLVDADNAYKVLSMSRSYFYERFKNKPQLKLIEHRPKGSSKVFYDPNELKRAVLSVIDNG
ncbi:hypothetical protein [Levilactobacillus enshiensis]|uniref:hypothetical protein n=1 Tax=Levilactobacillus enshiensis TaxID=2590213 RepID=UPI00117BA6FA|nr:hypothetical protein [Levilactobacillus enshiensis]